MKRWDEEFDDLLARRRKKGERYEGEWECTRCGYVRVGEEPPAICPECGATADKFEFWELEEDWDWEGYE